MRPNFLNIAQRAVLFNSCSAQVGTLGEAGVLHLRVPGDAVGIRLLLARASGSLRQGLLGSDQVGP